MARKKSDSLRRRVMRDLEKSEREAHREKIRSLRERARQAKAQRKRRLREAKQACNARMQRAITKANSEFRAAHATAVERQKAATQRRNDARRARVRAAREKCELDAMDIRNDERERAQLLKAEAAEARRFRKQLVQGDKMLRSAKRAKRRSVPRRERQRESDDYAKANIPAALHPLWERVKHRIKGGSGLRRDEAFLEYAHEHPDEVHAAQSEAVPDDSAYASAHAAWDRDRKALPHDDVVPF